MALLKSALEESLLSQQEQVALRVCLHIDQLANGLTMLKKLKEFEVNERMVNQTTTRPTNLKVQELESYLKHRIDVVLTSYTVPSLPKLEVKDNPT